MDCGLCADDARHQRAATASHPPQDWSQCKYAPRSSDFLRHLLLGKPQLGFIRKPLLLGAFTPCTHHKNALKVTLIVVPRQAPVVRGEESECQFLYGLQSQMASSG